ncbi:MAG: mycofactocin precursor MftA [Acidimicrobiales bacterium]|jgi:mycofactocin precursor|nr:mycofactocin precursor MftA [Acidimicrobiales bacterium]
MSSVATAHEGNTMDQTLEATEAPETTPAAETDAEATDDELLVEEISIDGMCGVY